MKVSGSVAVGAKSNQQNPVKFYHRYFDRLYQRRHIHELLNDRTKIGVKGEGKKMLNLC